ncbi:AB hydrolase-1 domain-containing protein [Favolaschia claudopus]|uniref:AB hydrolase-1 domain-containing protein n=1 Tax=Favolaschia claudopus TaxID=2862362 RepID=A0AAV9ZC35_9AGAR
MPHIDLETSAGVDSFFYTISTPTEPSASSIIQALPTIILIHPLYTGSVIFHPIFANNELRRFNLVSIDLRGHGWTSAKVDEGYGIEIVADDVLRFMDRLKIPTCHVAGMVTGASIALQMAMTAPERILSVFMMSPAPQKEPEESIQGRKEIADCWVQAYGAGANEEDQIAVGDVIYGSMQLAYNNEHESSLTKAVLGYSLSNDKRNWTGPNLRLVEFVTVNFFLNQNRRPPLTPSSPSLLPLRAKPILLVHCSQDIIYPRSDSEQLLELLRSVDADVRLVSMEGAPHYGNVTHTEETNTLLYEFVMAHCEHVATLPPPPEVVESPFLEELAKHGLLEPDTDSEDSL